MPPKRTIGGSGDAGAGEAPAQRVKLATEVSVAADEVSRGQQHDLDFVGAIVPPSPPPAGAGGQQQLRQRLQLRRKTYLSSIYPFVRQTYQVFSLVNPPTPPLYNFSGIQILWLCSLSP